MRATIHPYRLRLAHPLHTARGAIEERVGWVVAIRDDAGRRGLGEAAPLPGWSAVPTQVVGEALHAWAEGRGSRSSLPPSAAHAVSTAELDLAAQAAETTVAAQLSEGWQSSVPVAHLARDARHGVSLVAQGARCLKLKVATGSPSDDLARVAALREAVGPDIAIRIDANQGWSLSTAEAMLPPLAELGVALIEEPVERAEDMAALRGSRVAIAADESVRSRSALDTIIAEQRADVVVLKPMLIGTLQTCTDMIAAACAAGLHIILTTSIDALVARRAVLHLAAAVPPEHLLPCGLMTGHWLAEDLGADPVVIDGRVQLPAGTGLGLGGLVLPQASPT
jgi:o-succinylbenzoate synthase